MRALTVRQPYAERLVRGTKTVENRSRNVHLRGLVLIHAAAAIHDRFAAEQYPHILKMPRSSVVGSAQLVGAHRASVEAGGCCGFDAGAEYQSSDGEEFDKPIFHWLFADAVEFVTPIPHVKGSLGFWEPDARVSHLATIAEVA